LIDEVRARVSREVGRTVEGMSCYDIGMTALAAPQLEANGVCNYLIDPASPQVD
jgi:hypothetical protein